jgi:RimJ/RimL family protein N-acetyltransferase
VCYAGWRTEKWWDVSIDTVEAYRRRGYAARAVRFMIGHMAGLGQAPVWGALESNIASMHLAASLGFVAIDQLAVFSQPTTLTCAILKGKQKD